MLPSSAGCFAYPRRGGALAADAQLAMVRRRGRGAPAFHWRRGAPTALFGASRRAGSTRCIAATCRCPGGPGRACAPAMLRGRSASPGPAASGAPRWTRIVAQRASSADLIIRGRSCGSGSARKAPVAAAIAPPLLLLFRQGLNVRYWRQPENRRGELYINCQFNPLPSPEVALAWTELAAAAFLTAQARWRSPKTQAAGRSAKAREHRSKAQDSRIQAKVFQESSLINGLSRNPNYFFPSAWR